MRAQPTTWLRLTWPRRLNVEQATGALTALQSLSSASPRSALLLEVEGTYSGIEHRLRVPSSRVWAIVVQLRQALGGDVEVLAEPPETRTWDRAGRVSLSTERRPLADGRAEEVAAGLLAALGDLDRGETVLVQWWLGPRRHPISLPSPATVPAGESPLWRLWFFLGGAVRHLDGPARTALLAKQGRPGWRAAGRLAVHSTTAGTPHRRFEAVAAALQAAGGPGVRVTVRPLASAVVSGRRRPFWWSLAVNVEELCAIAAFPVGDPGPAPVPRVASRMLPPDRTVVRSGRIIGVSTYPGAERPVALSTADGLRHLHVLGPTGVGKSTLLLNLITQDMAAGRGVVLIEPKGDLVKAVLERVPDNRADDVIVLDPAELKRPVGLNPLQATGNSLELAVDHLVAVFKGLFGDSWGPRSQDILTGGLLTLGRQRGMSLVALPLLFTDEGFQRRLRSRIDDPLGLGSFWSWYDSLSSQHRATVLAPLMNKLRAFLLRPSVRNMVGQPEPRLNFAAALRQRRIILADLSRAAIGAEAAGLLGSLIFAGLWQAIRQRGTHAGRPAMFLYIDEFQDYLHLPTDAGEMLAQSRSLGVGLVLAHQHLGQLQPGLRTAVLANARSRVAFQLGHDDAQVLTRGRPELTAEDLMGLGAFEAYAQLSANRRVGAFASVRTLPPPPPSADADQLRQLSRDRYGVPVEDVEAAWRAPTAKPGPGGVIGVTRRRGAGGRP